MGHEAARDFLKYLQDHPDVRESLYHKVDKEIAAAAREAGFDVDRDDFDRLLEEHARLTHGRTAWGIL